MNTLGNLSDEERKKKVIGMESNKAVLAVRALQLRQSGRTYREIGQILEIAHTTAFSYIKEALLELNEETKEEAALLCSIELDRLDAMLRSIWARILKGDLGAIDRALKIQERRARLLGLDAPKQIEVDSKTIDIVIKKADED